MEQRLRANPYPGRGLVLGLNAGGTALVQAYWIMGRSQNSRNRVFSAREGSVWTEAADPAKVQDPSLIIYNALRELRGLYIVSNGDQTDTVYQSLLYGGTFEQALATRSHEPDAPNFTPRITGLFDLRGGAPLTQLAVLKASPFGPASTVRLFFRVDRLEAGFGYCITTYSGDGKPLPAFEGEPYLLPLEAEGDAIADALWAVLNDENKVSLAVKTIQLATGQSRVALRNKYRKV